MTHCLRNALNLYRDARALHEDRPGVADRNAQQGQDRRSDIDQRRSLQPRVGSNLVAVEIENPFFPVESLRDTTHVASTARIVVELAKQESVIG